MAEAQAGPLGLGPTGEEPLDQFEGVASTPEEWRRLIEQMRGTMGPEALQRGPGAQTLQPNQGILVSPTGQGFKQLPGGGLEIDITKQPQLEQATAPGEPPPGFSAQTPEGMEGADAFNRAASAAASAGSPGNRRAILRGVGGTAGMAGGLAATAGNPIGGAAGMFMGDYAGQVAANWLDTVYGSDAHPDAKPAIAQRMMQDMTESARDTAIASVAGQVLPLVWQNVRHPSRLFNRLMKLPPNSAQFLKEARSIGVDIGVANVTGTSGLGGGAVNVLSRMPFLGTKARAAANLQAKQLVAAHNDLFGKVAPGGQGLHEISAAALEEGSRRFENLALRLQARHNHAMRVGQEAGPILDTAAIKAESKRIKVAAQKQLGGAATNLPKNMKDVLKTLDQWPDRVSTVDLYNMRTWLSSNARKQGNLMYPAIKNLEKITDSMLASSSHPASKLLSASEKATADGIGQLSRDMSKKFGFIERNRYTGRIDYKPGTLNADDLAEVLERVRTPNQIGELRAAVGDDAVQAMGRMRLDQAWESALGSLETSVGGFASKKQLEFDVGKFNKVLGIDNMDGTRAATTEAMLKGTGVELADIARLGRVAHLAANAPLGDVSTFVMRASVLRGGVGGLTQGLKHAFALSVMGGATAATGATGGAGLATMLMLRMVVNAGLGKMMEPKLLRILTTGIDPKSDAQTKITALYHIFETHPNLVLDTNAP